MTKLRHIAALDGLRGAAILLVLGYHTVGYEQYGTSVVSRTIYLTARYGYTGVDLFFVLSGFLITRILVSSRNSESFYQIFYIRRMLRIFPLYYLAIVIAFFVLPLMAIYHPERGLGASFVSPSDQIWYWLNLSNFPTAFHPWHIPVLNHFWTLAVEEQFYLIWPTVVRRCPLRTLKKICAIGFFVPMLLRLVVPSFGPDFYYRITPFHMEGLLGGALLGLLDVTQSLERWRAWYPALLLSGCAGLFCAAIWPSSVFLTKGTVTFVALAFTGLVAVVLESGGRIAPVFSHPLLRRMGDYSYFMYVFHLMLIGIVSALLRHLGGLDRNLYVRAGASLAVCFTLGAVSHRFFEKPVLNLKRMLPASSDIHVSANT